ncbi:alanine racemase [Clostridium sp. 'deep sea']|uniref:alanine racemase n=1 Tax=Clostridium sp. 'deep sea' TaxID=2779445 RepID=UPI0018969F01|nr:alanine racemase [Clostridium sp. 'deep sea']QOR34700.1 alanine racemase [Clostridium sp. 'deep sea']
MSDMNFNSWIYIDKSAIRHNIKEVKKHIGDTRLLGVVKADAYGHGIVNMAHLMLEEQVNYLGVALPNEVYELRQAGIAVPILLMSPTLPDQFVQLVAAGCTLTINSISDVIYLQQVAANARRTVRVHININTGMYRYGVNADEALALAKKIIDQENLELEGLYTHFAKAESKVATRKQLEQFMQIVKSIKQTGIDVPILHCANSSATAHMPETHLDMVRVGTLLIGQCRVNSKLKLKRAWHLQAKIVNIINVPKGSAIGYGATYKVKRNSRLAIIQLGFADGISMWPVHRKSTLKELIKDIAKTTLRFFGFKRVLETALINGHKISYIGKVGMQHLALDITDYNDIHKGDIANVRILQAAVNAKIPRVFKAPNTDREGNYA